MDLKLFATVFGSVFLMELGDKTQIATLAFASEKESPKLTVFFASACALILTSALAVAVGALVSQHINQKVVSWIAGFVFIGVGVWTIAKAW